MLLPAFDTNNIPVVWESSRDYFPFVGVALKSLLETRNPEFNYDIIILSDEIGEEDIKPLREGYARNGISVRCFDPSEIVESYIQCATYHYIHVNYFRLALPWILEQYDKVINLGADILVCQDIAQLFCCDMPEDACVAGVVDYGYLGKLDREISRKELGLKHPENYINTDVMLLNLKRIRHTHTIREGYDLWQAQYLRHAEQDAINVMFQDEIYSLDYRWNVFSPGTETEKAILKAGANAIHSWEHALKEPFILHFAGSPKPWEIKTIPLGDLWWDVAKRSMLYSDILYQSSRVEKRKTLIEKLFPKGSYARRLAKKCIPFRSRLWILLKNYDGGKIV